MRLKEKYQSRKENIEAERKIPEPKGKILKPKRLKSFDDKDDWEIPEEIGYLFLFYKGRAGFPQDCFRFFFWRIRSFPAVFRRFFGKVSLYNGYKK